MKVIVTHLNPDSDAAMAVWLIRRFLPGWEKAEIKLVPAGETWEGKPVDNNPLILHVDTGLGRFDHHQTKRNVCAADLVWREILLENEKLKDWQKKAIERMLTVTREVDNARFLAWPQPSSDRWDFSFYQILGGIVGSFKDNQDKIFNHCLPMIDGIFRIFGQKVEAEEIIKNGLEFKTKWGKGVGMESDNAEATYLALKKGYALVVKKRSKTGHLGLYGNWQKGVNLRKIYQILTKIDPKADWFYHKSGCMVLNGSTTNPKMKPTKLELEEVVKILINNSKLKT